MRQRPRLPKIVKIEKIDGFKIQCMFNNGEHRLLDFEKIFNHWNVSEGDHEYKLLDVREFEKVELKNYTLSWQNVSFEIKNETGEIQNHPYQIGPDVLFELSQRVDTERTKFGNVIKLARIKAGLTQEQLAMRSGTTRFYISRIENNRTDVEMSTFRKIIEAGLGKHLRLIIE